jgi:hypothetical protein
MIFSKTKKVADPKPFSEKVAKRVAKIPTAELDLWTDQAIYELGRCLSNYQRNRDKAFLQEALNGAEALHAVVDELYNRMSR